MAKARTVNRLFAILRLVEKLCKSGLLASSIVLMNKALGGCLIDLLYSCGDNFLLICRVGLSSSVSLLYGSLKG